MHKELFVELTKLASEKLAYGVGYYGNPSGGYGMGRGGMGGMGRGGMMYAGRGGYMGPVPDMVPGMVRGQHAVVSTMGADAPERGIGAAREYQQYAGLSGRTPTTFDRRMTDQMTRDEQTTHMDDRRRHEQAGGALVQATREQADMQAQLRTLEAAAQSSARAYEGRGLWGRVSSGVGFGSGQTQYEQMQQHQSALDAARRHLAPQIAAHQRLIDLHEGNVARFGGNMEQYSNTSRTRGANAYGRTSDIDASRENLFGQMAPTRLQSDVNRRTIATGGGATAVGQPIPTPLRVAPAPGTPGGPVGARPGHTAIPHVPTHLPRTSPLLPAPGMRPAPVPLPAAGMQPQAAALFMMPLTMDNLIQGAARTMFDRYVKVAIAKVAVELEKRSNSNPFVGAAGGLGHTASFPMQARVGETVGPERSTVDLGSGGDSTIKPPSFMTQPPTQAASRKPAPMSSPTITNADAIGALAFMRQQQSPAAAAEAAAFKANAPKPPAHVLAGQAATRRFTEDMISKQLASRRGG